MKKNLFGQGKKCFVNQGGNGSYQVPVTGTSPIVFGPIMVDVIDNIGVQLINEADARAVVVTGTDAVVAATHTWTFANANFTAADVGGTITVSGATESNNNGTFTISSRTNATTIVTTGTQTDETFTSAVSLTVSKKPLAAAWTAKVSNDFIQGDPAVAGGLPVQNPGHFSSYTGLGTPAAVSGASSQYLERAGIAARALEIILTPTDGSGLATVIVFGKGND